MPVRNTYSREKAPNGGICHYWTEESGEVSNQLRVDDEGDSATFVVNSRTRNWSGPKISAETSLRMSYSDLEKLVERAQEILREGKSQEQSENMPVLWLSDVGPDEMEVKFIQWTCRQCTESSDWLRATDDNLEEQYEWKFGHHKQTKHSQYYMYTAMRNTASIN
jgi:hypothetical protein